MSLNSFSYSPHPNLSSILVGPLLLAGFNRGATEITQFWVCLATPIRYFPTPATQAHLVLSFVYTPQRFVTLPGPGRSSSTLTELAFMDQSVGLRRGLALAA